MSGVTKKDILNTVISIIVGLGIGFFFEGRSRQSAIEDAVSDAVAQTSAAAQEKLLEDFRQSAPDRLLNEFPAVFEQVQNDAFRAGKLECQEETPSIDVSAIRNEAFERGRDEACRESYQDGLDAGQRLQSARQSRYELAERDWQNYADAVSKMAELAEEAQKNPVDVEIQNALTAQAVAIAEIADDLETAYQEQASAFNSIMSDLRRSIEVRNYPRMRELSLAVAAALGAKGERFLGAHQDALDAFGRLGQ